MRLEKRIESERETLKTTADESMFRALADATSAAIFVIQRGIIRYSNLAASRLTGYDQEELAGLNAITLIDPRDRASIPEQIWGDHPDSEEELTFTIRALKKDGETLWLDVHRAWAEIEGRRTAVITAYNVTQRLKASLQLAANQDELKRSYLEQTVELSDTSRRMQALLQALPLGVMIADTKGRLFEKNEMVDKIWGGSTPATESVEGYDKFVAWWADSGEQLKAEDWGIARALNGEVSLNERINIQRFDGTRGTMLNNAAPILNDRGEIIGAVAVMMDITEQHHIEMEAQQYTRDMQRQAEELNAIFETLTDPLIVYSQDGMVLQANPAVTDLYGFDLVGKHLKELYASLVLTNARGEVVDSHDWPSSRAIRGEMLQDERYSVRTSDGRLFEMLFTARPLHLNDEFFGAVVHMQDVTAQTHLLAENVRRAEEMNAVIQAMAEAVIIYDRQGTPILVNQVALNVFGFDPTNQDKRETANRLRFSNMSGQPVEYEQLPSIRALRGEKVISERYRFVNAKGRQVTMLVSISPIVQDNQITGAVGVWTDVTEREQLLIQLEAERARLSTIITNAPEAILVADETGRIILANPAAERLYGHPIPYGEPYSRRSKQQIHYPDGTLYDPRDLPLTRSALDGDTVSNLEAVIHLPNGDRRHVLINSAPILDRNSRPVGAIAISQDIGIRKQVEDQIRKNAARAEVLASLSKAFAEAGLYYAAVLSTITHQITEKIGDGSVIRMTSDDGAWLDVVAMHHPDQDTFSRLRREVRANRLKVGMGISGRVLQTRKPLMLNMPAVSEMQHLVEQEFGSGIVESQTRSLLVIPLQAQGSLIGTLAVIRPQGEPYSADDQIFFLSLADRAALAIENSVLFADEARRARELDALHSATSALMSTLDLNALLSQILDAAQSAVPSAERGSLHLIEPDSGRLEIRATLNVEDERIAHLVQPNGDDYPSVVLRNRKPLLVHDAHNGLPGEDANNPLPGYRSLVIAPLVIGDEVIGTLSLTAARPFAFTKEDLRLLVSFAVTTSAAIQNAMLHAKVQTMAITDPLTEQYNRRGFFELAQREMERFSRYQYPLAAIMLDIDHFKEVNDTYGHRTGDRVLRALADRIEENIRHIDILGRYGGEEFAVLLPETELFKACEIAERIRHAVEESPLVEEEHGPISVSVSLGVTRASVETETLSELLERADQALYLAKQNGRNRVEIV